MTSTLKCDGNHGGPRCADPNCWNDDPVPSKQPCDHGRFVGCYACAAQQIERLQRQLAEMTERKDAVNETLAKVVGKRNYLRAALTEAREYILDNGNERTMAPVIKRIDDALQGAPQPQSNQAPIAHVTVREFDGGYRYGWGMYAPGLPPGTHDLYCEPPTPGGQKVPHPCFAPDVKAPHSDG